MREKEDALDEYVRDAVHWRSPRGDRKERTIAALRIKKAFSLLPHKVLTLFLSGARVLDIEVVEDTPIPLGMRTSVQGLAPGRVYKITLHREEAAGPEDSFIGSFLRELGHVVAERPPEDEWPKSRAERTCFKQKLESRADAMVWRWGLRHYSMIHLSAAYPQHRLDAIIADIARVLLEEGDAC